MWSVGCVIYFMLTQKQPFKSKNVAKLHQSILNAKYDTKNDDYFKTSRNVKDLIGNLLQPNAETRFSAIEALEHDWFKEKEENELDA